jgi:hypothetical protein
LYAIDLQSMQSHKLWNIKENILEQDFILAASMYYEPSGSSFYVASTEKGGILMKIFLNTSKWQYISKPISNHIPYNEMDFDLYYSPGHNKMFIVFNKTLNDLTYSITIRNYLKNIKISTLTNMNKKRGKIILTVQNRPFHF